MKDLKRSIRNLILSRKWKLRSKTSESGSTYYFISKKDRKGVIRISTHKQTRNTSKHFKKSKRPIFDFYPNTPDSLYLLGLFLDGCFNTKKEKNMYNVNQILDEAFQKVEVGFYEDVFKVGSWFLQTIKNSLTKEIANSISAAEFVEVVSTIYDKYIEPINLPGSDLLLDPIIKRAFLSAAKSLYETIIAS